MSDTTKHITLSGSKEMWQLVLAMLYEQSIPRHVAMPVIGAMEKALSEAIAQQANESTDE